MKDSFELSWRVFMRNLHSATKLTEEQKIAYIKILAYFTFQDENSKEESRNYILQQVSRFKLAAEELKNILIPRNHEELYKSLIPISTRPMAIDLLHCLWFAASVNSIISDNEISLIRKIAQILRIDNDTLLSIHHFVADEISFIERAKNILETDEVRC